HRHRHHRLGGGCGGDRRARQPGRRRDRRSPDRARGELGDGRDMNDALVPVAGTDEEVPWSRLDGRMLLIHPIEEILRLLPVLAGSFVIGTTSGNPVWGLAAT